jgi:hypothetical protein
MSERDGELLGLPAVFGAGGLRLTYQTNFERRGFFVRPKVWASATFLARYGVADSMHTVGGVAPTLSTSVGYVAPRPRRSDSLRSW